jgi:hypothetical protein
MAETTTTKAVNPAQLSVELGRVPLKAVGPDDDGAWTVRADVAQAALDAAVNAHAADDRWADPNPSDETVAAEARVSNQQTIEGRLDQALDQMRAHVARGTFTAAQRDAALLLVLRVCIGLVRITRRRLDGTD